MRNFYLLWGVVHLGTPGSTFYLKVVQIYGLCRWIYVLADRFLTEGLRENRPLYRLYKLDILLLLN